MRCDDSSVSDAATEALICSPEAIADMGSDLLHYLEFQIFHVRMNAQKLLLARSGVLEQLEGLLNARLQGGDASDVRNVCSLLNNSCKTIRRHQGVLRSLVGHHDYQIHTAAVSAIMRAPELRALVKNQREELPLNFGITPWESGLEQS